jgi:hypothetical protein
MNGETIAHGGDRYGMAKAAVHQLVLSLSAKGSGLPEGSSSVAILPMTLDTPNNRSATDNLLDFATISSISLNPTCLMAVHGLAEVARGNFSAIIVFIIALRQRWTPALAVEIQRNTASSERTPDGHKLSLAKIYPFIAAFT